mmetsp:Transcript_1142/g.1683  ORF Transcript_1142/g.1683 Transcript_1142/m.1683 type:complete len:157 (-) Transcript_1142:450-920(-)
MHKASKKGHVDLVRKLIINGADVNTTDNDEYTPLHHACSNGHVNVAKLLITNGAKVNAKNDDGGTPLHWACINGHVNVAKLLIEKGAEFNAKNNEGITPLDVAVEKKIDVVKLLQKKNATDGNVESFAKGAAKAGARGIVAAIAEELLYAAIGGAM